MQDNDMTEKISGQVLLLDRGNRQRGRRKRRRGNIHSITRTLHIWPPVMFFELTWYPVHIFTTKRYPESWFRGGGVHWWKTEWIGQEETLMTTVLPKIKPTDPLRWTEQTARKKRNWSDSVIRSLPHTKSWRGPRPEEVRDLVRWTRPPLQTCVYIQQNEKKTRVEGKKCHSKTMIIKRDNEDLK